MKEQKNQEIPSLFADGKLPRFAAAYLITKSHNSKYTRLTHSHENELELYYASNGNGYYMVDGCHYAIKEGDMVICNAGIPHGDDPSRARDLRSYCCAVTNVSLKGLPENWLIDRSVSPVLSCGAFSDKIRAVMELIYMLSLDPDTLGDVCNSLSISLILLVYQLIQSRERRAAKPERQTADMLAASIKEYIDQHYTRKITLESLSEAMNMTPSYISHIFKQEIGVSPIQYSLSRKFGEAQSLLMDTDLSVSEISDLLSFATRAHFNAMFKKHVGLTPGQYRLSIQKVNADLQKKPL